MHRTSAFIERPSQGAESNGRTPSWAHSKEDRHRRGHCHHRRGRRVRLPGWSGSSSVPAIVNRHERLGGRGRYPINQRRTWRRCEYLVKLRQAVGLIPETPGSCTFWLYSDNFLAATALLQYGHGQGNATLTKVAADILTSESQSYADLHRAENQYTLLVSPPSGVNASQGYTIFASRGLQIKATLNNGGGEAVGRPVCGRGLPESRLPLRPGQRNRGHDGIQRGKNLVDGVVFRASPTTKLACIRPTSWPSTSMLATP